jgi:FdhE protein
MSKSTWDERIKRAEELAERYEYAAEVLKFYTKVVGFQKHLYGGLGSALGDKVKKREEGSLRDRLDLDLLLPSFQPFLALVQQSGPPHLSQFASQLSESTEREWQELLLGYWNSDGSVVREQQTEETTLVFFSRAFLQPYAQYIADHAEAHWESYRRSICPLCSAKPQVGVLRPEGYGAKRSLVCSLCSTEWEYLRILCPVCEEHRYDQLSVFTASDFEYVRVETCESCRTYLKTVDLTKNGLAVPLVDELATIPLDLWAKEHGYVKLEPNLLGI